MSNERAAYGLPWSEQVMRDCLEEGVYHCEVAVSSGQLVAHMISQQILDECHLHNLCVSPKHQRKGLGLAMLQHLLDTGRCLKARRLLLEVRRSNVAAYSLYQSLGLRTIGERKGYYRGHRGREDALVMALEL